MRSIILFATLALALLAGCNTTTPTRTMTAMPPLTPPPVEEQRPDMAANPGSIFESASADYLFNDNRARKVGDIVLVNVVETTKATNKADTTSEKETNMNLGIGAMYKTNIMGQTGGGDPSVKPVMEVKTTSDYSGTGETKRENSVTATVAARVVNILPGGLMQVEGARQVRVNEETQILVVRGLVRPRDIGSDNTIYSTHMADAIIELYGEGVVADKQKPGWLARILDNMWPF